MRKLYLAIDPGKSGGIAWGYNKSEIHVAPMPVVRFTKKTKKGKMVKRKAMTFPGMLELLEQIVDSINEEPTEMIVSIEEQHSFPEDAKDAVFNAGGNYRMLFDAFAAVNRYHSPSSKVVFTVRVIGVQRWKAGMMVLNNKSYKKEENVKEITHRMLINKLGREWCDSHLLGPRGGYQDGIGDSVAILLYTMKQNGVK